MLNDHEIERYSRHIILQNIGVEGQMKIKKSKIFVVGMGGLGSPAALYLAAAGVGRLGIADMDEVDISNLGRQIIHFTDDVGRLKVDSAEEKIKSLNPNVDVKKYSLRLKADNILDCLKDYDFVIDGTDNFSSKFLINDACVKLFKPYSHGGILRFTGQTMTVVPGESACYRCVFKSPPSSDAVPTCASAGVLGSIAGMLGTIQATEALKFVTDTGKLLTNKLLYFNSEEMDFRKISVKKDEKCAVCGKSVELIQLRDEEDAVCEYKPGV